MITITIIIIKQWCSYFSAAIWKTEFECPICFEVIIVFPNKNWCLFGNFPIGPWHFLWILKGLVILGILEMPCSKYSNFPKKTKYGLCWRRWSLRWGSGNVLTATPSALDAGWDWRSESESRWQSQIDNYNDNDLHNILSGTSSRAKDAPPAQGLFWFVASI